MISGLLPEQFFNLNERRFNLQEMVGFFKIVALLKSSLVGKTPSLLCSTNISFLKLGIFHMVHQVTSKRFILTMVSKTVKQGLQLSPTFKSIDLDVPHTLYRALFLPKQFLRKTDIG